MKCNPFGGQICGYCQAMVTDPDQECTATVFPPMPSASAPRLNCLHLGDELRRVGCSTCSGTVELKVLACEVHGECTIATELPGVKCCAMCGDYVA